MGGVAVYTRLNGVILWLGDFMLYDSDDLLSQTFESCIVNCVAQDNRYHFKDFKIQSSRASYLYLSWVAKARARPKEAYNSETIWGQKNTRTANDLVEESSLVAFCQPCVLGGAPVNAARHSTNVRAAE